MLAWHLIVLLSALTYTVGVIGLKKAMGAGASIWTISFWTNLTMAVLYQPCWLAAEPARLNAAPGMVAAAAVLFFAGQIFAFGSLRSGDVSVATPLLGTKVLFVVFFTWAFFGDRIGWVWLLAGALTTLGIFLVTGMERRSDTSSRHLAATALQALLAGAVFALADTIVQHGARLTGAWGFIAEMYSLIGLLTLGLYLPIFRSSLWRGVGAARGRPLALGALLIAVQNIAVTLALRYGAGAAVVNVVYSSRCVMSVLLAWAAARWLKSHEAVLPRRVLLARLSGAALLFVAILLVVL